MAGSLQDSEFALHEALTTTKDIDSIENLKSKLETVEHSYKCSLEKWDREREQHNHVLSKKNELIDTMRVKLNRYEFAIKEAMLFLAKPMEGYTAWLQNDPSKSVNHKDRNPSEAKSVNQPQDPAQLAQKQQKLEVITDVDSAAPSSTLNDVPAVKKEIEAQDIPALECIRLSLNYLRAAQNTVQALKIYKPPPQPGDTEDIKSPFDPKEHEPLSQLDDAAKHERVESEYLNNFGKDLKPMDPSATDKLLQEIANRHKADLEKTNEKASETEFEGDLTLAPQDDEFNKASPTPRKNLDEKKCDNCHELMLRIDHLSDQTTYLKRDVVSLVAQLNEERSCRQRIQLSKDILDQELEELTSQLFDQANKMVIDEATLREQIENNNHELAGELKDLSKKFENREEELKGLRRYLVALDSAKNRSTSVVISPRESTVSMTSPVRGPQNLNYFHSNPASFFSSRIGPNNSVFPFIPVDGILLSEFADHIKTINSLSNLAAPAQQAAFMQTLFMKRSLLEDIEPCLYYTYSNHTNNIKAASMSSSYKRRLFEGVLKSSVDIKLYWSSKETLYLGYAGNDTPSTTSLTPLKEKFGPPKKRCSNCGITRECDYRIRFPSSTAPMEWNQVCRFCRDRIASVADFFTFMSNVKAQAATVGILGMFRHVLWLKRRMAVSRVGCCSLFEGQVVASVERGGGGGSGDHTGDWEKMVQVLN